MWPVVVEDAPVSNKKLASISPFFVENAPVSKKELASISLAHSRVAVSCRAVSAVCFFVLILNNAPALRAGKYKFCILRISEIRISEKF